jgi:serine/threonine protein kinase
LTTTHPGPPSPLSLSRSSSLRNRPPPLPLDFSLGNSSRPRSRGPPRTPPIDSEPLSPLHQSPSLPPIGDWTPPQPPSSDDVTLRFNPRSAFLLGEGRYATVFLGSYRKDDRKGKSKNPNLPYTKPRIARTPSDEDVDQAPEPNVCEEINKEADGYVGGTWRLCAAKRMAPDRQSQTMGLREAFFLNRLAATANTVSRPGESSRRRAISPLRDGFPHSRISRSPPKSQARPCGSVYVVKLIAVKEDGPSRTPVSTSTPNHGRSASEAVGVTDHSASNTRGLVRQRSSTMMNRIRVGVPDESHTHLTSLSSFPSLPSLAQAAKAEKAHAAPALTRLVLILEHAPLGTMDRFLRTSPGLVGKALWQRWAVQTTEALQWVHAKGIVHADIKAGNLLVRPLLLADHSLYAGV